jgi:hypothetical protein
MGNGCSFSSGEGVVETMTVSLDVVEAAASEAATSFDAVEAEELEAAVESEADEEDMVLRTASRGFTNGRNDVRNSVVFFIFIQSFFRMF